MGKTQDAIAKTQGALKQLGKENPEFMQGFQGLMKAVDENCGLDLKTLELIMVGLAVNRQCAYCIHMHVAKALKAGASRKEILAATQAAVIMGGGPALMYAQVVLDCLDDLSS